MKMIQDRDAMRYRVHEVVIQDRGGNVRNGGQWRDRLERQRNAQPLAASRGLLRG